MPALAEGGTSRLLTGTRKRVMFCITMHFTSQSWGFLYGPKSFQKTAAASSKGDWLEMRCAFGAGIEYMTGTEVESVDIKNKTLKVASGGESITYDKLIIATGSTVSVQDLYNQDLYVELQVHDRSQALPWQQLDFTSLLW